MARLLLFAVWLAWLCCYPIQAAQAQPKNLEFTVEQQGPTPLPHQAVRLRLSLHNRSDQPLANLQVLESAASLTRSTPPAAPKIKPLFGTSDWIGVKSRYHQPFLATAYAKAIFEQKFNLPAGQTVTVTSPFGLGLLQRPGEHQWQFGYMQRFTKGFDLPAKPFTLQVQEPAGDDALVCKALDENPKLVSYYYAIIPYGYEVGITAAEADFFRALLEKYPKSSYADYFRLLLANYHFKYHGKGELIPKADDIAAGVKLLEAVNVKEFPFGPDVLLLLRKYSKDPAKVKQLEAALQANYRDAYEWLEEQAENGVAFEKIQENRRAAAPEPKKP